MEGFVKFHTPEPKITSVISKRTIKTIERIQLTTDPSF